MYICVTNNSIFIVSDKVIREKKILLIQYKFWWSFFYFVESLLLLLLLHFLWIPFQLKLVLKVFRVGYVAHSWRFVYHIISSVFLKRKYLVFSISFSMSVRKNFQENTKNVQIINKCSFNRECNDLSLISCSLSKQTTILGPGPQPFLFKDDITFS